MSESNVNADEQTFETAILRSWNEAEGAKSFVLFSSPNCVPCQRVKQAVESLEEELQKVVGFINVYHALAAAQKSQIRSVPTLVKFQHGAETARLIGDKSRAEIEAFLRS